MQLAPAPASSKEASEDAFSVLDFKNDLELKLRIQKEILLSFYKRR